MKVYHRNESFSLNNSAYSDCIFVCICGKGSMKIMEISAIMALVTIVQKNKMKNSPLPANKDVFHAVLSLHLVDQ